MIANFRLIFAFTAVLLATILLGPVQLLAMLFGNGFSRKLPLLWHRFMLWCVGTRVHIHGDIPRVRPLLIVANHISWSDILILGSAMELCFIAKNEVKSWPGINLLASLQRTVFVNRERQRDSKNQADTIANRLLEDDAMVLFAEGTTGDGHTIMPFKSALFGAAQYALDQTHQDTVLVQPVAIAYTRLHGMPLGRFHQSLAAWPGDVALAPHLLRFLREGAYDVDLVFGDPISFHPDTKRREIALAAETQVREMFAKAMQGHYLRRHLKA